MADDQRDLIVRDPNVCHGQATIRGTRVLVSVVLDNLASGLSEAEIVAEYPTINVKGVRAAAAYGAELAKDEYPAVAYNQAMNSPEVMSAEELERLSPNERFEAVKAATTGDVADVPASLLDQARTDIEAHIDRTEHTPTDA